MPTDPPDTHALRDTNRQLLDQLLSEFGNHHNTDTNQDWIDAPTDWVINTIATQLADQGVTLLAEGITCCRRCWHTNHQQLPNTMRTLRPTIVCANCSDDRCPAAHDHTTNCRQAD